MGYSAKKWLEVHGEDRWLLDMNWLMSNYECVWGKGCPGVEGHADIGCCHIGTPIEEEELEHVLGRVSQLTSEEWQQHGHASPIQAREEINEPYHTATVTHSDGAVGCVFANRSDHPAGGGCAFHVAAMRRGESYLDWKPITCWTAPISVQWIEELECWLITMMNDQTWFNPQEWDTENRMWDFWCDEAEVAYVGTRPVYQSLKAELERAVSMRDTEAWPAILEACEKMWHEADHKMTVGPVAVTLQSTRPW